MKCYALLAALLCVAQACPASANSGALPLSLGPHLFLDDVLIDTVSNVVRKPLMLTRDAVLETPLITAEKHQSFQPFFTVLRDTDTGNFRMWYGVSTPDLSTVRSRIAYMESADGIDWRQEPRILDIGPVQFGTSVIDEGPAFPRPEERYKLAWYYETGLRTAVSSNGLQWTPAEGIVIPHNHDINGIFRDPIRNQYVALLSFYIEGDSWRGKRRVTKQSISRDFHRWEPATPAIAPDAADEGETQFYGMDAFLTRGELIIGMVKVLRDDLTADTPPEPADAYGIGYTTIAWTRNGRDWTRERTPFLDRSPRKGAWDHAHAWIDEQVLIGDAVYLYYAGYKSGHKANRFRERQIGLIQMKRDRYVGREARGVGMLRTKPLRISGSRLFVNVDAGGGELRVQLLAPNGKPLEGFALQDCAPIDADLVKVPVQWSRDLASLSDRPVVIEFSLRNATLFGFETD